jgi:hypothetical protein
MTLTGPLRHYDATEVLNNCDIYIYTETIFAIFF